MLLQLIAGSILGLGLVFPGAGANQKPADCCALNLACCELNLPCCQGAQADCCKSGQKCCAEGKSCCAAHATVAKGSTAKVAGLCACCAMKTAGKAGVQVADCCSAKLACCTSNSACCSANPKPDCCKAGAKCCAENKECCKTQK